uniref:Choline/carnitine acyltransferase domain-containing protein n=1 Tax=Vombatus ursinus TaxID=29139 RepID=A0A4X2KP52_VOMUR
KDYHSHLSPHPRGEKKTPQKNFSPLSHHFLPTLFLVFLMKHCFHISLLPIPELEDSIKRYMAAQKPLLGDSEYRNTEKLAKAFKNGIGKELHRNLIELDKKNFHTSYVTGQGFDRHLFALRYLAESRGDPMPEFYQDPAYQYINYNILSTSTLNSPSVFLGGFGPLVPDGFGIGYNIYDYWLGCNITSYVERDLDKFLLDLEGSLNDFFDVFQGRSLK